MNNDKEKGKIIVDVFLVEENEQKDEKQKIKKYCHFTSFENAIKILKNKEMIASAIKNIYEEAKVYNKETAERKFSMSFASNLTLKQEKEMFEKFGKCEIIFYIDDDERVEEVLVNTDKFVSIMSDKKELAKGIIAQERELQITVHYSPKLKRTKNEVIFRMHFADVTYKDKNNINVEENMYDKNKSILNKTQPIRKEYKNENESRMTFTVSYFPPEYISIEKDKAKKEEKFIFVGINIEKIKKIEIKTVKKINIYARNNFIREVEKLGYDNIKFI